MRIGYDPNLIEQSVGRWVHGKPKLEAALHRRIDPFYAMAPGRERETEFRAVYGDFFKTLGLNAIFMRLLRERPNIAERVERCLIREAPRTKNESAELLVKPAPDAAEGEERTLIMQVSVESVVSPERIEARLRRELLHVSDMLDDAFLYRREQVEGLPARQNLLRDRYRVLWDIYIEGRLTREERGDDKALERSKAMFERVFGAGHEEAFDRIFETKDLTHPRIFEWADSPELFLGAEASSSPERQGDPGAPCPLCGFSTFDWFDFETAGGDAAADRIQKARTDWEPRTGSCRQCAEIYQALSDPANAGSASTPVALG